MAGLCTLDQTDSSKRPTADKLCSGTYAWSDGLGILAGHNFKKNAAMTKELHLSTIKDSKSLADALNKQSDKFFGRLKGHKFLPGEDIFYIPFNFWFMAPMNNIHRHQNFAYMKVEDEYIIIRLLWDEEV